MENALYIVSISVLCLLLYVGWQIRKTRRHSEQRFSESEPLEDSARFALDTREIRNDIALISRRRSQSGWH
ncbi:hypothetical protein ABHF33_11040 [Chitinibacter sp. FCG-7]|uniref:Uncharacterized protein n=1 Tax=Chitinibacter mangrovi TaxID=3153927 RepID=A0AAU7F7F7_9NEIS